MYQTLGLILKMILVFEIFIDIQEIFDNDVVHWSKVHHLNNVFSCFDKINCHPLKLFVDAWCKLYDAPNKGLSMVPARDTRDTSMFCQGLTRVSQKHC